MVRSLSSQRQPATRRPGPLALARRRPPEPLVSPQTPRALGVDGVTLPTQDRVRRLPTPPRMPAGDLPQPAAHLLLNLGTGTRGEPLGRTVLAHHSAGASFGDPEATDEHDDCSPAPLRGQKFPSASSLSIDLSSSASARSFFNRAFSASSSRSRFASLAFMPPYWVRQRFQLDSDTSRVRSTSARSLPSLSKRSPSRSLRTICSGV